MACNGDALRVGDAALDEHVHGRLRAGDQLRAEIVVGLLVALAHDRHLGVVEHGIAQGQVGQRAPEADLVELVGRLAHLAGHRGILVLQRIGPHQHRQRAVALFITGRQVERAAQVDAVVALVLDELLGDAGHLRVRMREFADLGERVLGAVAHEEVGLLVARFAQGQQLVAGGVEHLDDALVVRRLGMPQPLGFTRRKIVAVEEGDIALRRGAVAGQQHLAAVKDVDHPRAELAARGHRGARVVVDVVVGTLVEQHRLGVRVARLEAPDADHAIGEAPVDEHRQLVGAPFQAGEAPLGLDQGFGFALEGRGPGGDAVMDFDLRAHVAAVLGLGPDQGSGRVGAPLDAAPAGAHRIEALGNVLGQGQLGDGPDGVARGVEHHRGQRKARIGHRVGKRLLDRLEQDVVGVGRGIEAGDQAGLGQLGERAVEADAGQPAGGQELEALGVGRGFQQVLVGPHRRLVLGIGFLDDRGQGLDAGLRQGLAVVDRQVDQ